MAIKITDKGSHIIEGPEDEIYIESEATGIKFKITRKYERGKIAGCSFDITHGSLFTTLELDERLRWSLVTALGGKMEGSNLTDQGIRNLSERVKDIWPNEDGSAIAIIEMAGEPPGEISMKLSERDYDRLLPHLKEKTP